jgi:hypothetical protein
MTRPKPTMRVTRLGSAFQYSIDPDKVAAALRDAQPELRKVYAAMGARQSGGVEVVAPDYDHLVDEWSNVVFHWACTHDVDQKALEDAIGDWWARDIKS